MKKYVLLFVGLFLLAASVASAGMLSTTVGVVVIGGSDFKTPVFYDYAKEGLSGGKDAKYRILVGNDMQSKYQEYWLEEGFLEEQQPKKQNLLDFVKFSRHDKVLYLVVKDPVTEVHQQGIAIQTRASVQINAFLCDTEGVVKSYSTTREDDSYTSDLRAKRGAFLNCMKDIGEAMKPFFLK